MAISSTGAAAGSYSAGAVVIGTVVWIASLYGVVVPTTIAEGWAWLIGVSSHVFVHYLMVRAASKQAIAAAKT